MSPRQYTKEEEDRIYEVKSFILNSLHLQFTITKLARKAALGRERFQEGFKELFGMPAGSYVQATRMETGRFLLYQTDKSVKEIARLCGYSKTRNFSSAYKKFFEKSPSEERSLVIN